MVCFRWRIVINGEIDGFYCLPVFLNDLTTMKLTTSQKPMLFLCVYTDRGVKNVKVAGHNPVEIQAVFTIKE